MNSSELRTKYLEFFKKNGHKIIPSASLIPENDPTVLFTTAGMHPLVPYLLGQNHPEGKRLTDAQKCIRTGDIDDVGDDTHLTFFEMLGNWSLGDYWKKEAISWSFEFLTSKKWLGIDKERLAVSCFAGDKNAPKDEESAKIWEDLEIKKERIAFLPKEDNWWGPAGKTGPCGPDTEMFYWKLNDTPAPEVFDAKNKNWVEIWNDVFMQYVKNDAGEFVEAKQKNVDTGMGLERTIAVLNGKENVYETDLFLPIIEKIEELSGKKYQDYKKEFRIIADHVKASVFLLSEGVLPGKEKQNYVLRKLIRRAVRYASMLGMEYGVLKDENVLDPIADVVIEMYKDVYPTLENNKHLIIAGILTEEIQFRKTLANGLKKIEKFLAEEEFVFGRIFKGKIIEKNFSDEKLANTIFDLYQTDGFPIEMSIEEFEKAGMKNIDKERIRELFKQHQELSRTASAGMFKGGLADNSEQVTKYHTATHLLLAGLRKYLGGEVFQKGSNLTAERLRLDFSWPQKVDSGKLHDVENFVNGIIKKDLPVFMEEMTIERARELNAMGVFGEKYGAMVKVYTILDGTDVISREICGGPHVDRTGVLGHFKIQKEESSSSGVRRIKAILE